MQGGKQPQRKDDNEVRWWINTFVEAVIIFVGIAVFLLLSGIIKY